MYARTLCDCSPVSFGNLFSNTFYNHFFRKTLQGISK